MLDPKKNRINFGDALRPIEGYDLDFAVGTTYTLDLEAIMFLPISLFFGQDLKVESSITNELLSALRQVPDKIQLYCQKAKIKANTQYHPILSLWDKSINHIHMDSCFKSFHPKIWIIRYCPRNRRDNVRYRFICSSRNLTRCNDWDVAITMEGEVTKKLKKDNNAPLLDFLKFLDSQSTRKIKKEVLKEVPFIDFDLSPGQESFAFHSIGNGKVNPLLQSNYSSDELLIISPFLQDKTLNQHLERTKSLTVFSTAKELDKIDKDVISQIKHVYQFNPNLERAANVELKEGSDQDLSEATEFEDNFSYGQSLHAKVYVVEKDHKTSWYIGSANCTNPARENNIEFLTSVTGKLNTPGQLRSDLTKVVENGEAIFIRYTDGKKVVNLEEDRKEEQLRKLIYDLSSLQITGNVIKNESGTFDYEILIYSPVFNLPDGWEVTIKPLSMTHGQPQLLPSGKGNLNYIFKNFDETYLTPYLAVVIHIGDGENKEFVVPIEIEFSDDRIAKILKSILGNQEKLLKYLSYLLTREEIETLINLTPGSEANNNNLPTSNSNDNHFPIYEKLLLASSRDQTALKSAVELVESLKGENDQNNNPIVGVEFEKLMQIFREV